MYLDDPLVDALDEGVRQALLHTLCPPAGGLYGALPLVLQGLLLLDLHNKHTQNEKARERDRGRQMERERETQTWREKERDRDERKKMDRSVCHVFRQAEISSFFLVIFSFCWLCCHFLCTGFNQATSSPSYESTAQLAFISATTGFSKAAPTRYESKYRTTDPVEIRVQPET